MKPQKCLILGWCSAEEEVGVRLWSHIHILRRCLDDEYIYSQAMIFMYMMLCEYHEKKHNSEELTLPSWEFSPKVRP